MMSRKLIPLSIIVLVVIIPIFPAQGVEVLTKPISRPLPTLPEPVRPGDPLRVEITANMPLDISASLVSIFENVPLTLSDGPTEEGALWVLIFKVPDIRPDLYDLHINFTGKSYVQEHSVWVLEEWPESLVLSQISDIHQPYGGENFTHYIYEQNLLDPDLIFVTGDIVDVETIARAWDNLHGTMKYSNIPIYLEPGNHDYTNSAQFYKQYGGKTNYTVTIGDFFIVALDSHGGGYVRMEEIAWANKVLSENPDKVKIVCFHHPLFSGEYEEDLGTIKGGEITGNWQNVEELEDIMYFTWSQNMENAREILKVIQENDVNVILSGHVHRDLIYHLNEKHWFITTTTIGAGTSQYRGYRLLTIGTDGSITLDEYASTDIYNPPNSIPLEKIKYLYKQDNDGTSTEVSAIVWNDLEMTLNDVRLEYIVDNSIDPSSYTITPTPNSQEIKSATDGHHFIVYYDIPQQTTFTSTIYTEQDTTDPEITLHLPENYDEGISVLGAITATDVGWGVETVTASYSIDGSTWTDIPLTLSPIISPTEWTISFQEDYYEFTLPGEGEITVNVEVTDFAGNTATKQQTVSPTVPKPEPEPANIVYNSISASPSTAEIDEEITVTITLENKGDLSGTETVELKIDDELLDSETITIDGGATETVTFTITRDKAGTFTLQSGDKTTAITILEPEPEPEPIGGIPIPAIYVVLGIIAATYLISKGKII
jgi:3',5'-cyclic AMP phosphodiesterase CpdA